MKNIGRYAPLITFTAGFVTGINAGRSWLSFFSITTGLILASVAGIIWHTVDGRRRMKARRVPLERLLDEMIRVVEGEKRPLDAFVMYNWERETYGFIRYSLQVRNDTSSDDPAVIMENRADQYELATETATIGRFAGWVQVKITTYDGNRRREAVNYPDLSGWTAPESWIMDRVKKLRQLVGDASAYETRRQRLAQVGIEIEPGG